MNRDWRVARNVDRNKCENPAITGKRPKIRPVNICIAVLPVLLALGIAGCDRSGGDAAPVLVTLEFQVSDVTGAPISDANVVVTSAGVQRQVTTNADGIAVFPNLPTGPTLISISAAGFEPKSFDTGIEAIEDANKPLRWNEHLNAVGAWAVGRAVVLGTQMVDMEYDGSALTFAVDVAVIDENSDAIETLTSADFAVFDAGDCGWGGPRECASNAAGNASGAGGNFNTDGGAQHFGLQPANGRRPYLVSILAERSTAVTDWDERAPALKSFFTQLGGNDLASLASVQVENSVTTLTVHGPFTNDGSIYLDVIDRLAIPAGNTPKLPQSISKSIRLAADASASDFPGTDPAVLVMATPEVAVSEFDELSVLARQLGVRINVFNGNYGYSEMAVRSGGFATGTDDPRQLGIVFGAMDRLLAGSMPHYRMQFRITGDAGTFVPGGNVKVRLGISVPTSLPHLGVHTSLDVAIP